MTIEVLIVGAGAIGAFYGSRIAAGNDDDKVRVSCICRSNYSAVKAHGFAVASPQFGEYEWRPARTFANAEEARRAKVKWTYLVVTTKALPDITDDSKLLEGLVSQSDGRNVENDNDDDGSTSVVLIQNGLGVEAPYAKRFPTATILSAVTIASAAQDVPGHIKHNRWTRINVGPFLMDASADVDTATGTDINPTTGSSLLSSSSSSPPPSRPERRGQQQGDVQIHIDRNATFVRLLTAGGIKDASAYTHSKLQLVRWHKIAINAAMNPSSVLSGGTDNNTMSLDPDLSAHLLAVMREVLETAPRVVGQPLPADFATPEQILRSTQKNTSKSVPSMQIDWAAGKPMELEVILGNPIRLAQAKGLDMPRTQTLYALLKMAQQQRNRERENNKDKKDKKNDKDNDKSRL